MHRKTDQGKVPEWSIGPHSKCGVRATVPGVRIPPFPPQGAVYDCSFLFFVAEREGFVSRWRYGRVVCAVSYCSVGELLRNRKPCAYNQKVNKFPFRLSAQCLQLRCSPPPQYIFCLLCSNLLRPFESHYYFVQGALLLFFC